MSNVFILGAGFTKDISSGKSPSLRELGREIKEVVSPVIREKYRYDEENFEIFVTKLTLDLKSSKTSSEEKRELEKTRKDIRKFLKKRLTRSELYDASNENAKKFIDGALTKNDIIITLNYDCLLEYILFKMGKWSPKGGGYFNINNYILDQDEKFTDNTALLNIKFYKLHGSLNFVEAKYWGPSGFINDTHLGLRIDEEELGIENRKFGIAGAIGTYLIEPSYIKKYHPMVIQMFRSSAMKIKKSENVTIIGCAIRDEDSILQLISFCNCDEKTRIRVIDPDAEKIKEKIRKIYPQPPPPTRQLSAYPGTLSQKLDEYLESYKSITGVGV